MKTYSVTEQDLRNIIQKAATTAIKSYEKDVQMIRRVLDSGGGFSAWYENDISSFLDKNGVEDDEYDFWAEVFDNLKRRMR